MRQICESFPNLQGLSITFNEERAIGRLFRGDGPAAHFCEQSMTNSLNKLQHLESLRLDSCLWRKISPVLGPQNTLSLSGLPKLQSLTIPFHFFILESDLNETAADPGLVLPESLSSLTLLADFDYVEDDIGHYDRPPYFQNTVLDFLEALCALHPWHFSKLREITYFHNAHGDMVWDGDECSCVTGDWPCSYHNTLGLVSLSFCIEGIPEQPQKRFKALVEEFAEKGVLFQEKNMKENPPFQQ